MLMSVSSAEGFQCRAIGRPTGKTSWSAGVARAGGCGVPAGGGAVMSGGAGTGFPPFSAAKQSDARAASCRCATYSGIPAPSAPTTATASATAGTRRQRRAGGGVGAGISVGVGVRPGFGVEYGLGYGLGGTGGTGRSGAVRAAVLVGSCGTAAGSGGVPAGSSATAAGARAVSISRSAGGSHDSSPPPNPPSDPDPDPPSDPDPDPGSASDPAPPPNRRSSSAGVGRSAGSLARHAATNGRTPSGTPPRSGSVCTIRYGSTRGSPSPYGCAPAAWHSTSPRANTSQGGPIRPPDICSGAM